MELNFHHVGGRWGTVPPLKTWSAVYNSINLTLYEPDEKSWDQLNRLNLQAKGGFKSVSVLPFALGAYDGPCELKLCFDRNASSIHEFNPAFSGWSFFTGKFGRGVYSLGIANKPTDKISMTLSKLDTLKTQGKIDQPDILSVDAEGASMDILVGGADVVEKLIGVYIEGCAAPIRHGEAPFSSILQFLRDKSFLLISAGSLGSASITEMPIGVYDRGVVYDFEDAIFIKDPNTVSDTDTLLKLALFSLLCGCTSIAHVCFQKLDETRFDFTPLKVLAEADKRGAKLICEFYAAYQRVKNLKLPKINETHTESLYTAASYLLPGEQVDPALANEQYNHKRAHLAKYVPHLVTAMEIHKAGGIYAPLYRKYGLQEFGNECAKIEHEQLKFLMDLLKGVNLITVTE